MCGSDAPPAPKADPKISKAAEEQVKLGKEYLKFSKEQFAVSQERQKDIDALTKEVSTFFLDIAKTDRARYETVFKPLEDDFVKTATEFDSPERQAEAAAKAGADVQSAAARERGAMERNSASFGIKPDSGRYAGIDRAMGLGTALGSVDAQNTARDAIRDKGLALKADAINLGRGVSATGTAAAGSASQPSLAANAQWQQTPGIVAGGYQGAQQGYGAQASTLGNLHAQNIGVWNSQNEMEAANAAGIGQFAGQVAGAALPLIMSSKDAKTNRKAVVKGKALKAVEDMPVESYDYKPGIADGGSHVGPMAEDFKAATGKGDGKTIPMQDMLGVTMAAVKDLASKVEHIADVIGLGGPRAATA